VIAAHTNRAFERENASSVGVGRIREIIQQAEERLSNSGRRTVLFLDEIHRFNKAQQDVLLGDVERGLITLIGATTENPLFAVNSALVSRSTLFRLEPLSPEEIKQVVRRAIADKERGYGKLSLTVTDEALDVWAIKSDGDARRALNALEVAVLSSQRDDDGDPGVHPGRDRRAAGGTRGVRVADRPAREPPGAAPIVIDRPAAEESIQQKAAVYAGTGGYRYAHDESGGIGTQDYLGVDKRYYRPTDRGAEKVLGEFLERARAARKNSR
jgi:putative ATPase